MKVGWLHDDPGYVGGAELTMAEFKAAAPDGVTFDDNSPDVIVLGNVASFSPYLIPTLEGKRVVWYHNDLSPHIDPDLKGWLDRNAEHVFCSPLQQERYGLDGHLIPPPVDLDRFRSNGTDSPREGTCSVGAWQNPGKGQIGLWEWSAENGPVDVYGDGPFAPYAPPLNYLGPLKPEDVPGVLHRYERFVFLPWEPEPFGRSVAEAHAAGCELVVNRLVGATYWLEENPGAIETAAEDFWRVVTEKQGGGQAPKPDAVAKSAGVATSESIAP